MLKKQPLVTLSSTKAEYVAMTQASKEVIWLCHLFAEMLFLFPTFDTLTLLYGDNQGMIQLAQNAMYHVRTKHIDVQHHFICQAIALGHIELDYVETNSMVADIFTKALARQKFELFRFLLGVY